MIIRPRDVDIPHERAGRIFRGVNIGANVVCRSIAHLPENQRILVRWLHTYARARRLEWTALEEAVGHSSNVLYRVFCDKYRYAQTSARAGQRIPIEDLCASIAKLKSLTEQSDAGARPRFVETSIWQRVQWLCRRSSSLHSIGLLYGESQLGKTTCLEEFARRDTNLRATYIEMPPAAGLQLMTKTIAEGLHVNTNTCYERLISDVLDAVDSSSLLIIDEIHRVFLNYQKSSVMRCLDVLRHIHDRRKCGMIICGTNAFRDQMHAGEFFQYLKQLRWRGPNAVQLPSVPPRSDLDLMAASFGMTGGHGRFEIQSEVQNTQGKRTPRKIAYDSEELIEKITREDGFGNFIVRLQDAVSLASERSEPPTWAHFCKAHHIVYSMCPDAPQQITPPGGCQAGRPSLAVSPANN